MLEVNPGGVPRQTGRDLTIVEVGQQEVGLEQRVG